MGKVSQYATAIIIVVLLLSVSALSCAGSDKNLTSQSADNNSLEQVKTLTESNKALSDKYDEAVKKYNQAVADCSTSQKQYDTLKVENSKLDAEYKKLALDYSGLKNQYASLESTGKDASSKQAALNAQISQLQAKIKELETKIEGTLPFKGSDGSTTLKLKNNFVSVSNPTRKELYTFLASDGTDDKKYQPGVFTSREFAVMLHNNAEAKGIRCGVVAITFETGSQVVDVFYLSDEKKMVYIDCSNQADAIAEELEPGGYFRIKPVMQYSNFSFVPTSGQWPKIKTVNIYW